MDFLRLCTKGAKQAGTVVMPGFSIVPGKTWHMASGGPVEAITPPRSVHRLNPWIDLRIAGSHPSSRANGEEITHLGDRHPFLPPYLSGETVPERQVGLKDVKIDSRHYVGVAEPRTSNSFNGDMLIAGHRKY